MCSMVFSDEEARFLRLVLRLAEKEPDDNRASWAINGLHSTEKKAKPADELRILVIGDKGVGKTSLLAKLCTGVFPDPSTISTSVYAHGCRHSITIDSRLYAIDALELPADHLAAPERLAQALAITDAAILVYDITNLASITYLKSLASAIDEAVHHSDNSKTSSNPPAEKRSTAFCHHHFTSSSTRKDNNNNNTPTPPARPYHFLLLGTKTDVPSPLREVTWLEGHVAATEFFGPSGVAGGASASFMEVSARTGENIGAAFRLLGREVLMSRMERQKYFLAQQQRGRCRGGANGGSSKRDGGGVLAGSMRKRWCALKSTLSSGIFRKEGGK
ncbi:P-loop containing nucleoside triphosphate hydrolase protein [Cryphonectria parasitica EP155]|uniref:P-loop containing nucleoside triphosphate hydrolase protein n=1 Tax=Cryphonectria parasitica (strain ATCC 38755 / EP155) TaxID=660469 RepID=A0A9P4XTH4_CRYP1|nr:P-loop containing nucleoside triphosphate hydrolase protein [Cryphonectria parasitica EP155]KAF3761034.1 P-loop containing nucleoside triphosphate hydrolase protein [Cryphonectria parasitica EP155]